ncbi:MAG: ABC transporter ATP-binding protein [Acidobacteria bacterium]|nr:ABC transporter ATP-binding protein [Acidobacteriota bacterium]MBI3657055.1 ABC transporter ATP-binding protein [Acidobacteriota bacterium]
MNDDFLKLTNIAKRYGTRVVVDHLSLTVHRGELLCFLGPSGSGKTTLLRMMAGLEIPDEGRIEIHGATVAAEGRSLVSPQDRRIGFVFQDLALWPHLTVGEHLDFVLGSRGVPRRRRPEKIEQALSLVRLHQRASAYPSELSGGEQQRVGLARALVTEPRLLLFDEPLANLDIDLKAELEAEIRALQQRLAITSVYITHDPGEAFYLGERIAILQAGRLVQVGSSPEILERPASDFVARLMRLWQVRGLRGAPDSDRHFAGES